MKKQSFDRLKDPALDDTQELAPSQRPDAPICYRCRHRGELAGDAHSCCRHPKANKGLDQNNIAAMAEAFMGKAVGARLELNVKGAGPCWPANFDPAFVKTCDGFEPKRGRP